MTRITCIRYYTVHVYRTLSSSFILIYESKVGDFLSWGLFYGLLTRVFLLLGLLDPGSVVVSSQEAPVVPVGIPIAAKRSGSFFCKHCSQRFASEIDLVQHLQGVERLNVCRVCRVCGKYFRSANGHKYHMLMNHNANKSNFRCQICGRFCQGPSFLRKHMKTHDKAKD